MNQVVLHMLDGNYLGRIFECFTDEDIRLSVNLICQDVGVPELNNKQFEILMGDTYYCLGLLCGNIYIGGLESVS